MMFCLRIECVLIFCLFGDVCLKDVEKLSFLWMNFYDEDVCFLSVSRVFLVG